MIKIYTCINIYQKHNILTYWIQEKITNSGAAVHPKNYKLQIQKKQIKPIHNRKYSEKNTEKEQNRKSVISQVFRKWTDWASNYKDCIWKLRL